MLNVHPLVVERPFNEQSGAELVQVLRGPAPAIQRELAAFDRASRTGLVTPEAIRRGDDHVELVFPDCEPLARCLPSCGVDEAERLLDGALDDIAAWHEAPDEFLDCTRYPVKQALTTVIATMTRARHGERDMLTILADEIEADYWAGAPPRRMRGATTWTIHQAGNIRVHSGFGASDHVAPPLDDVLGLLFSPAVPREARLRILASRGIDIADRHVAAVMFLRIAVEWQPRMRACLDGPSHLRQQFGYCNPGWYDRAFGEALGHYARMAPYEPAGYAVAAV